jgi:Fe-S-cluster containining protein
MPGFPPKYAIVEIYTRQVVSIDGKVRQGGCLRCGKCCYDMRGDPCEFLMPGNVCRVQDNKPLLCLLFPVPGGPKIDGCGFRYEE